MAKRLKCEDDSLTIKEETFVQELLKGNTQRESYLIAYTHAQKWKNETVDVKASKLLSKDKIQTRFQELKQKLIENSSKETIMKATEILEIYTRIARGEEEEEVIIVEGIGKGFSEARKINKKISAKDRLKALERLDKILNLEKNNENDNNIKDDGLTKQIEKAANSDIWEDLEDDSTNE